MAMLRFVTITGACDTTDIAWMATLSELHPRLEWGILVGCDGVRFPSERWMNRLLSNRRRPKNLSLHICGEILDSMLVDGDAIYGIQHGPWWRMFNRVQLNFHGQQVAVDTREELVANIGKSVAPMVANNRGIEIIFQLDGVHNDLPLQVAERFSRIKVAGLHDTSHGAGIVPKSWPRVDERLPCGWAGGLGPDNFESQLHEIRKAACGQDFWVDMETRVRTPDGLGLDPQRVEMCLEQSEDFILSTESHHENR